MKLSKFNLFCSAILISILVFAGCSKDSNNPTDPGTTVTAEANLTLNGAGYTNKAVKLGNGISAYSVSDTMTAVLFSGKVDNDSLFLYVIFKGNQTGTFNWSQENGVIIYKTTSTGVFSYFGIDQGTMTISTYGAVGAKVDGTVSGKLIEATSQAELNITGSFSGVRVADIP